MTAISTVVGVITLSFAFYEHHQKERAEEIAHWQRVLIYKIISEGSGASFRDLKIRYVTEAQQLQTFKLPTREIQDDALRYALLDLQRDKVIYLAIGGFYRAVVEAPTGGRDSIETAFRAQFTRQENLRVARPYVFRLINREGGRYTAEELLQRCHDDHITIEAEDFYNLIADLRAARLAATDTSGKLYGTHDIDDEPPQPQEPTPPPQPEPEKPKKKR